MDFTSEHIPTLPVLYMRRIGAYGVENHKLMESLKTWARQKGLFENSVIYGIAQDNPTNTPHEQCRYDVCLVVERDCVANGEVQHGEIPSGKYVVFTIPHTAEAVQAFWASIFQKLMAQNLQYDESKPILERYKHRLVEAGQCEFCVPII
ncbi:MAG: GyrI-like domain-containing protein [Defluviitaleaceae bacterium]|nr:GyrI-like domain-containing protein [Defluviitaleaceae bacterium]